MRLLILFLCVVLAQGCASLDKDIKAEEKKLKLPKIPVIPKRLPLKHISITADENANNNMATAVDLVFINDKALLKTLPKNSLEWFAQKQQWLTNNPIGLELRSLEIPPEKSVDKLDLPWHWYWYWGQPYAVTAYIKYFNKQGQSALNLTKYKHAFIRLKPDSVEFGELD